MYRRSAVRLMMFSIFWAFAGTHQVDVNWWTAEPVRYTLTSTVCALGGGGGVGAGDAVGAGVGGGTGVSVGAAVALWAGVSVGAGAAGGAPCAARTGAYV